MKEFQSEGRIIEGKKSNFNFSAVEELKIFQHISNTGTTVRITGHTINNLKEYVFTQRTIRHHLKTLHPGIDMKIFMFIFVLNKNH